MTNMLFRWGKSKQFCWGCNAARPGGHGQTRRPHSGFPAPLRLALLGSLVALWLLGGVRAVTFEEISSGYHTLQSRRIQSTLQFLASKHFNGRATGTPDAELTTAYIAS